MSLSRPASFPLLKLPWLCIKCVVHNSDEQILIYFATISNRARRIVQHSKYPLKEFDVYPSGCSKIHIKDQLGKTENDKTWYFLYNKNAHGVPLVLKRNSQPLPTSSHFDFSRGHYLRSHTADVKLDALKMFIEFMIDVFGCTIGRVFVDGDKLSDGLVISSVKTLYIREPGPVNSTDLKILLENIKVTHSYVFQVPIPANFSCDPQVFKCRILLFACNHSADWVTLELLCQFDVSQLVFSYQRFSFEDIVSYVTHWFNSENRKLEYVQFKFRNLIFSEDFEIAHLNPMPFCEKRRNKCPFVGRWKGTDMSSGIDILRKDGLLATFYVNSTSVIFYVWHKRFQDAVQP
ncbi:unnamed protein product [Caenorhabditis brenneri]